MALGLGPLSLESLQKHAMTTPASSKLRGYDKDSQLSTPKLTLRALNPTFKATSLAMNSTLEPALEPELTDEQSMFIDD